jgi:hypothetical protein
LSRRSLKFETHFKTASKDVEIDFCSESYINLMNKLLVVNFNTSIENSIVNLKHFMIELFIW